MEDKLEQKITRQEGNTLKNTIPHILKNKFFIKSQALILAFSLLLGPILASEERREEAPFNQFFTIQVDLPNELKKKMLFYMTEEHIRKLGQVSKPWRQYIYERYGDSVIRALRSRVLSLVEDVDLYQCIKQAIRQELPTFTPDQQTILLQLIEDIVPPQKKLSPGINFRNRFEFLQRPHSQHILFEPLHEHILLLSSYKTQLNNNKVKAYIDGLTQNYTSFIKTLVEQTQALGVHTPSHLFEVNPYLQGEGIEPYQLDVEQAYKIVSHDLLGKLQRLNESGLSPVAPIGGIHFKVDPGNMLLDPAWESAVYHFYRQMIGFGITPTLLISIHDLTMLSPHDQDPRLKQIFSEEREKLGGISEEELFRRKPELELLRSAGLRDASFMIQASLSVKGKGLDKFLEEVEKGEASYDQLDRRSFSGHILASLLLNPTDYKPDNLMVDEQGRIIGIDNDRVLEGKELRALGKEHVPSVSNILYCLPLMQEPIEASVRASFLKHIPTLSLLTWLQEIKRHEEGYNQLLAKQYSSEQAKNKKLELNMPLKFVSGSISWMHEQWIKLQSLLHKEEHLTHEQLFKELQPLAHRYYQGLRILANNPVEQIRILYQAKDMGIHEKVFLETMLFQHYQVGDEKLRQLRLSTSFKKKDPNLLIEDAIRELVSTIDLGLYSSHQKLLLLEHILKSKIIPQEWHKSWQQSPQLLIEMIQQGARKGVLNLLIQGLGINVNNNDENGRTALHHAANGNLPINLEQIESLVSFGTNLEAQDSNKCTALDLTADNKQAEIFAKLVSLGAGKKAIPNKIRRFYESLSEDKKQYLGEIFSHLAQTNPKIGWQIALDTLMPSRGKGEVVRTISESDRYLLSDYVHCLFDESGQIKRTNQHGRRSVAHLTQGPWDLHIKLYPELPGMELAVSRLMRDLGYEAPYSELAEIRGHPALITQTITGETLYDVLLYKPEVLQKLDPYHLSMAFIMAMLVNPEDGNPTNYIVSPIHKLGSEEQNKEVDSYKIISIDNDHAFMPAVAYEIRDRITRERKLSLQVKTILYCMDAMKDTVHPSVVEHFKALDPLKVLGSWLNTLEIHDQEAKAHFNSNTVIKLAQTRDTVIGVPFAPNMLKQLYTKMVRLQIALAKKKAPTHLDLLNMLEPALGQRYERAHLAMPSSNIWERFKFIDGPAYNIDGRGGIISTASLAEVLASSSIPAKAEFQKQIWKNEYGPRQALKELQEVEQEYTSYEQILKNLKQANSDQFKSLKLTGLQELLTHHIDFSDLSLSQQQALFKKFKGTEFRRLQIHNAVGLYDIMFQGFNLENVTHISLKGCTSLRHFYREGAFAVGPLILNNLKILDLRECSSLINIKLIAPAMKRLKVNGCSKLKEIEVESQSLTSLMLSREIPLKLKNWDVIFKKAPNVKLFLDNHTAIPLTPKLPCNKEEYALALITYMRTLDGNSHSQFSLAHSQYCLARIYHEGIGVEKNVEGAIECYFKAIEKGYIEAAKPLGLLYYKINDYRAALKWLRKAANNDDKEAARFITRVFFRDYVKSEEMYDYHQSLEQSAEQGDIEAQVQLGMYYLCYKPDIIVDELDYIHIEQEYKKSIKWLKKAKEGGYIFSSWEQEVIKGKINLDFLN